MRLGVIPMPSKPIYREVKYIVGVDKGHAPGKISFFPLVHVEGHKASRVDDDAYWVAALGDVTSMSVAYGAALAECDQLNAHLQERGLNRLREAS